MPDHQDPGLAADEGVLAEAASELTRWHATDDPKHVDNLLYAVAQKIGPRKIRDLDATCETLSETSSLQGVRRHRCACSRGLLPVDSPSALFAIEEEDAKCCVGSCGSPATDQYTKTYLWVFLVGEFLPSTHLIPSDQRKEGAEFAQTAWAQAIKHRRMDERKKALRDMKDFKCSDTTISNVPWSSRANFKRPRRRSCEESKIAADSHRRMAPGSCLPSSSVSALRDARRFRKGLWRRCVAHNFHSKIRDAAEELPVLLSETVPAENATVCAMLGVFAMYVAIEIYWDY